MVRKQSDYSKGFIYKIICKDETNKNFYIGSSVNFKHRKQNHKSTCYNENDKNYNLCLYKHIRQNGGFDNFEMIKLEDYPCKSRVDLETRENYYWEKLKPTLNNNKPKSTVKEQNKRCYEKYKDKRLKECKEYYENNKEKCQKKRKEYYENNKEEINKKRNIKIKCDICDLLVSKSNIARHKKTKHK